ncbi:MAG: NAD-dependent succinate-semialdehyde dehydrogenase [Myxococcota bacterium]
MPRAISPVTDEVVREIPEDDEATVERKLQAADEAFGSWGRRTIAERADLMRAVARLMRDRVEELAPLMTEEMGKPIKEARGEVGKCAWVSEHYAEHAEEYLAPVELASDATQSWVQYQPLGVILGIMPWNSPFWLAFRYAAPALMAGNTCLLKHDRHVPGCARAIRDLFEEAGYPPGVFDVLYIGSDRAEPVIKDRRIAGVSLTGSAYAGAMVGSQAASALKPSVMELGGSDPFLVFADADLEAAARIGKTARIINAGQSCIAAKRMIVEEAAYDRFVELLEGELKALKLGDPADEQTDVGPMARKDLRDDLHRQVRESIEQGAACRMGGELPEGPGCFYPVTLLSDVTPEMTAFREETFGPVAAVVRARDEGEMIALANDTPYGLGSSVFTRDTERARRVAARIAAGQVAINGLSKTDPRLPTGGIKDSGYGRELGPDGILEFVNRQAVWMGPKRVKAD